MRRVGGAPMGRPQRENDGQVRSLHQRDTVPAVPFLWKQQARLDMQERGGQSKAHLACIKFNPFQYVKTNITLGYQGLHQAEIHSA